MLLLAAAPEEHPPSIATQMSDAAEQTGMAEVVGFRFAEPRLQRKVDAVFATLDSSILHNKIAKNKIHTAPPAPPPPPLTTWSEHPTSTGAGGAIVVDVNLRSEVVSAGTTSCTSSTAGPGPPTPTSTNSTTPTSPAPAVPPMSATRAATSTVGSSSGGAARTTVLVPKLPKEREVLGHDVLDPEVERKASKMLPSGEGSYFAYLDELEWDWQVDGAPMKKAAKKPTTGFYNLPTSSEPHEHEEGRPTPSLAAASQAEAAAAGDNHYKNTDWSGGGSNCTSSVAGVGVAPAAICANFSKFGHCVFGPSCRFSHDSIDDGAAAELRKKWRLDSLSSTRLSTPAENRSAAYALLAKLESPVEGMGKKASEDVDLQVDLDIPEEHRVAQATSAVMGSAKPLFQVQPTSSSSFNSSTKSIGIKKSKAEMDCDRQHVRRGPFPSKASTNLKLNYDEQEESDESNAGGIANSMNDGDDGVTASAECMVDVTTEERKERPSHPVIGNNVTAKPPFRKQRKKQLIPATMTKDAMKKQEQDDDSDDL